ncbi:MAG: hypothetical protein M3512_06995, partial [Bacteroidota bacterium]|nr:hypothetical protein [Bacteroidota bacterium]
AYDTLDNKYINDVTMYFISSKKAKEPFNVSVAPSETEKISEKFKMELMFTKPVFETLPDSIFFRYDSLNIVNIDPETDFQWNNNKDKLVVTKILKKNLVNTNISSEAAPQNNNRNLTNNSSDGAVQLYIANGSFISIENDSSKVIDRKYKFIN